MSTAFAWCEPGSADDVAKAIEQLYRELPGWWFSIGNCHVSADATVGPDAKGPDAWLLQYKEFDDGIDGSLPHPATIGDALRNAISLAKEAKRAKEEQPRHIAIAEQIAGDYLCAQGGFNDRVLNIIPYLTPLTDEIEALKSELRRK
jgi:hypothetical protein